LKGTKIL